jgi:hypothetical protein
MKRNTTLMGWILVLGPLSAQTTSPHYPPASTNRAHVTVSPGRLYLVCSPPHGSHGSGHHPPLVAADAETTGRSRRCCFGCYACLALGGSPRLYIWTQAMIHLGRWSAGGRTRVRQACGSLDRNPTLVCSYRFAVWSGPLRVDRSDPRGSCVLHSVLFT